MIVSFGLISLNFAVPSEWSPWECQKYWNLSDDEHFSISHCWRMYCYMLLCCMQVLMHSITRPYSQKIWWGIKFGGLAVQFATAKLNSANISYLGIYVWRSLTEPPKFKSTNILLQWWFRAQLPNLIPANISGYTVYGRPAPLAK